MSNNNNNYSNAEEYVDIYDLMPGNSNNKPKNALGRMASLHFPTKHNFQTPTKKRTRNAPNAPKKAAEQNGYSTPKRQMIENNSLKNMPNAPKKHKSRKTRRIIRRK